MTEKLTMKKLSGELEMLRKRVLKLEQQLKPSTGKAAARPKSDIELASLPEHGASIDTEHRQRLIEEEAYLIAERRDFQSGDPGQDWAEAEKRVNHRLMEEDVRGKSAIRAKRPAKKRARTKQTSPTK